MQTEISIIVNNVFEPVNGCPNSRVNTGLAFVQADELVKHLTADYNCKNIRTTSSKRSGMADIISGMRKTLEQNPREFYIINDGITITVDRCDVSINKHGQKVITLCNPVITNGGLTREELELYVRRCLADEKSVLASVRLHIHIGVEFFIEHMGVANVGSNTHSTIAPALVANGLGYTDTLKSKIGLELSSKIDWKSPDDINTLHKTMLYLLPGHTWSPVAIYNSQPTKNRDSMEKSLMIYEMYHEEDMQLLLKIADSLCNSITEAKQHYDEQTGHTYEWAITGKKNILNIPWSKNPRLKMTKAEYALVLTAIKQLFVIDPITKRVICRIPTNQLYSFWIERGGEMISWIEEDFKRNGQSIDNFAKNPESYKRAAGHCEASIKKYERASNETRVEGEFAVAQ
jgi:hypothetical protein